MSNEYRYAGTVYERGGVEPAWKCIQCMTFAQVTECYRNEIWIHYSCNACKQKGRGRRCNLTLVENSTDEPTKEEKKQLKPMYQIVAEEL